MLFNSYIFLLLFLPICLVFYFILNNYGKYKLAQLFLLGMSMWFYGYFNPNYLLIIGLSIIINYYFSKVLLKEENLKRKRILLGISLVVNLGVLFYYKYFNFFVENLNYFVKEDISLENIVLPLGISFFTFQQISYVIDSYKGEVVQYNFLEYASFVVYFPQLIAGPIVSHEELIPQFREENKKILNWDNFSRGIYIFILGLAKKVLIADVFGNAVNWGFADITTLDSTNALLVMLAYTIQIYFDFSGYCDMAIGLAKMMNFDLPLNFDSPYKATSIDEFWDRWHMTLTRFFTKYVYIPLGGSRKGEIRTCVHIMVVYMISGFWHGANWTFVIWGVLHGVCKITYRLLKKWFQKIPRVVNQIFTFLIVNLLWVLFRSESIHQAVELYRRILQFNFGPIHQSITEVFGLPEFKFLVNRVFSLEILFSNSELWVIIYFSIALIIIFFTKNAYERMCEFRPSVSKLLFSVILLVWSVLSFSGVSTFLYFNF